MASIYFQPCDPGECSACEFYYRGAGVCSITLEYSVEGCPLKKVIRLDEREKYTSIKVEKG